MLWSRRTTLFVGGVAIAATLAACSSGTSSTDTSATGDSTQTGSSSDSSSAPAGDLSGTLNIIGYSGVWQDQYEAAVIKPFQEKYPNLTVNYQGKRSSGDMLASLQSEGSNPSTDVAIMDSNVAKSANDQGMFEKVSADDVPNISHVLPGILDTGGFGPLLQEDAVALLYDTEKVTPKPTSWNVLWDTKYKGEVSVVAPPSALAIDLTMITSTMQGEDFTKSIDKSIARLKELAPNVQSWAPLPDEYQSIITGQTVLGMGQNARGQYYSDQSNGKLGLAFPAEGTMYQLNTINLMKGAPDSAAAKAFMDYALSPDAQIAFAKVMFYAPSVDNAPLPAEVADRVVKTDGSLKIINYDPAWLTSVRDAWTDRWKLDIMG